MKYLLAAGAAVLIALPVLAQSRQNNNEKKTYKPGSAWTLQMPLGEHLESTIDTLLYNYQRQAIPSLASDAYVTTGNLGAEGQTLLYMQRKPFGGFFFDHSLRTYIPQEATTKFYNVYIPMTLMSYNFGGGRTNQQDRFRTIFAGNVNRRIGVGAHVDYLYSKGSYENQATKDFAFGVNGYYRGDRYQMQAFFNFYDFLNKENGGITDELYITDPAVLQGGISSIDPKSIPTNLTAAHSRLKGAQFMMNHSYSLGYWDEEVVNDTLTRDVYIPVTRFIYTFNYQTNNHFFHQNSAQEEMSFWESHYFSTAGSRDYTKIRSITNTFGVELVEGFRKWAKFGLQAYVTWNNWRNRQASYFYDRDFPDYGLGEEVTPLPAGVVVSPESSSNRLWVGGDLQKQRGTLIRYAAKARFGLIGAASGDIELSGNASTRFKMLGDTVAISAHGLFANVHQPSLLQNYVSNNFVWKNNFGKTRRFRVGGKLVIPWTLTELSADFENVQNLVYFGPDSKPLQEGGSVQIFSASLNQKLHFGIWNWYNTITYQVSSNHNVVPLPALSIYSNMFLRFKAFRALELQIGIDCDFYTKYNSYLYQPATMTFHVQDPENVRQVGAYPFCDVYITAKLYKTRFFLMMSHVNQGWLGGKNYFSMPLYPLNPRRFQLGLSVDFAN